MKKKITALTGTMFAAAIALAGCSSSDDAGQNVPDAQTTATESGAATAEQSSSLTLADGYCRAKEDHLDLTACFGTLVNSSDADITVESFTAPDLEGASTELHEVVDGQMRQKEDGFTIPAGGSQELAPGGEHLMVMNYPHPIQAGDTLTFNLVTSGGEEFTAEFPVREQPSGEEDYAGGEHDSHQAH